MNSTEEALTILSHFHEGLTTAEFLSIVGWRRADTVTTRRFLAHLAAEHRISRDITEDGTATLWVPRVVRMAATGVIREALSASGGPVGLKDLTRAMERATSLPTHISKGIACVALSRLVRDGVVLRDPSGWKAATGDASSLTLHDRTMHLKGMLRRWWAPYDDGRGFDLERAMVALLVDLRLVCQTEYIAFDEVDAVADDHFTGEK